MEIKIELTITLDNEEWGTNKDDIEWLRKEVLSAGRLYLHSNEIGDTVGEIKSVDKITINPQL